MAPTAGCVLVAGQPPGSWTGIVIGVVVLILLLLLCAGIVWFVVSRCVGWGLWFSRTLGDTSLSLTTALCPCRRRKDVPIKAKDNN